ncbi:MAG: methyltransferase [Candidatus Melainabacteria bacterium]
MVTPMFQLNRDTLLGTLFGFTISQTLITAIELDLFTRIASGSATLPALMAGTGSSERGLRILLDALVGLSVLTKTPGKPDVYALSPTAAQYLVAGQPDYLGGMARHARRLYENWGNLAECVQTGQPAGGAQSLNEMETFFSDLVTGLVVTNRPVAATLAKELTLSPGAQILDVAGGMGVWSAALLKADPSRTATLLDLPRVVEVSSAHLSEQGLTDRYTFLAEDLENYDFPEAEFDCAILAHICHALGPVASQKLIAAMAGTLKPGGTIVIVDFIPDDRRAEPGYPLHFATGMLVSTPEGNVFTASEYSAWLKEAGFSDVRVVSLGDKQTAILASR